MQDKNKILYTEVVQLRKEIERKDFDLERA
jgi:hypothetical protein